MFKSHQTSPVLLNNDRPKTTNTPDQPTHPVHSTSAPSDDDRCEMVLLQCSPGLTPITGRQRITLQHKNHASPKSLPQRRRVHTKKRRPPPPSTLSWLSSIIRVHDRDRDHWKAPRKWGIYKAGLQWELSLHDPIIYVLPLSLESTGREAAKHLLVLL